jgi:hypothetical protein
MPVISHCIPYLHTAGFQTGGVLVPFPVSELNFVMVIQSGRMRGHQWDDVYQQTSTSPAPITAWPTNIGYCTRGNVSIGVFGYRFSSRLSPSDINIVHSWSCRCPLRTHFNPSQDCIKCASVLPKSLFSFIIKSNIHTEISTTLQYSDHIA